MYARILKKRSVATSALKTKKKKKVKIDIVGDLDFTKCAKMRCLCVIFWCGCDLAVFQENNIIYLLFFLSYIFLIARFVQCNSGRNAHKNVLIWMAIKWLKGGINRESDKNANKHASYTLTLTKNVWFLSKSISHDYKKAFWSLQMKVNGLLWTRSHQYCSTRWRDWLSHPNKRTSF